MNLKYVYVICGSKNRIKTFWDGQERGERKVEINKFQKSYDWPMMANGRCYSLKCCQKFHSICETLKFNFETLKLCVISPHDSSSICRQKSSDKKIILQDYFSFPN